MKIIENLYENAEGIYSNNARDIWEGNKKIILKNKKFEHMRGNLFYLCEEDKCYGVVKINDIKPVIKEQFDKIKELCDINENDRWWKEKEILFMYDIDFIHKYKEPKKILIKNDVVKFVMRYDIYENQELKEEEIKKLDKRAEELEEILCQKKED